VSSPSSYHSDISDHSLSFNEKSVTFFGVPFCSDETDLDYLNYIIRDFLGIYVNITNYQRIGRRHGYSPRPLHVNLASKQQANLLISLSPTLTKSFDYVLRRIKISRDSASYQRPIIQTHSEKYTSGDPKKPYRVSIRHAITFHSRKYARHDSGKNNYPITLSHHKHQSSQPSNNLGSNSDHIYTLD
jgi:hypothetical protein